MLRWYSGRVLREFLLAIQFLTSLRVTTTVPFDAPSFRRAIGFFPLVGCSLGVLVWGGDMLLQQVCPLSLRNVIVVGLLAILSRGLHLDGLADSADGLLGGSDRQRSLEIMKDSRIGTFGTLAVLFVLVLKIRSLDLLVGDGRIAGLVLGPMLSRWAYVVMAYRAVPARPDGLGAIFMRNVSIHTVGWASVFAGLVAIVFGGIAGVLCLVFVAVIAYAALRYCTARLGGMTGDTFGATGEVIETLTFCWFALSCSL
ncbi:MAG: adenosylcobinamide-GDP ribazoletransferase [Candidatus Binatia bacterium]